MTLPPYDSNPNLTLSSPPPPPGTFYYYLPEYTHTDDQDPPYTLALTVTTNEMGELTPAPSPEALRLVNNNNNNHNNKKEVVTWARGRQLLLGVSQSPHTLKVTFRRTSTTLSSQDGGDDERRSRSRSPSPVFGAGPSPGFGVSSASPGVSAGLGPSPGFGAVAGGAIDHPESASDQSSILTSQGRVDELTGEVLLTGDKG